MINFLISPAKCLLECNLRIVIAEVLKKIVLRTSLLLVAGFCFIRQFFTRHQDYILSSDQ